MKTVSDVLDNPTKWIKHITRIKRRARSGKGNKFFYKVVYIDDSEAIYLKVSEYVLLTHHIDQLAGTRYCGKCKKDTEHLVYRLQSKIECIECNNLLGANDARPFAQVISLKAKKTE
jgi:hypothetical protein